MLLSSSIFWSGESLEKYREFTWLSFDFSWDAGVLLSLRFITFSGLFFFSSSFGFSSGLGCSASAFFCSFASSYFRPALGSRKTGSCSSRGSSKSSTAQSVFAGLCLFSELRLFSCSNPESIRESILNSFCFLSGFSMISMCYYDCFLAFSYPIISRIS